MNLSSLRDKSIIFLKINSFWSHDIIFLIVYHKINSIALYDIDTLLGNGYFVRISK